MKCVFDNTKRIVYKDIFVKKILDIVPYIIIIQISWNIVIIVIGLVIKNLIIIQTAENLFNIRLIVKYSTDFFIDCPIGITSKGYLDRMRSKQVIKL